MREFYSNRQKELSKWMKRRSTHTGNKLNNRIHTFEIIIIVPTDEIIYKMHCTEFIDTELSANSLSLTISIRCRLEYKLTNR